MQFRDGNYISSYIAGKPVESAIFVCTITQSNFTKGHFYFYSGVTQTYEDITPEGTGGGPGGGGTVIGRPILTVQTQLKDEYIQLFSDGETETKTFADYLKNCMYYNNGTLIEITK